MGSLVGRLSIVIAVLVALSAVSAAAGEGGGTIATAPMLPVGSQVTGGAEQVDTESVQHDGWHRKRDTPGVEFYRVALREADELVVELGLTAGSEASVCLLGPDVTDETLAGASCLFEKATRSTRQVRFRSPASGQWTMVVGDSACCPSESWGYTLTAWVKRSTRVKLDVPALVRPKSRVRVAGSVSQVRSGRVRIEVRKASPPAWRRIRTAPIGRNGQFALTLTIAGRGGYVVTASYAEDATHRSSAKSLSFIAR